ncbi:MAG: imidazole glycerol phosphate synthase subunit HisH [Acidaminococcaceae bacterium]|nr:imidazole glycerol phosphate synthase subunit HisH [Acidaminococcaceae bacterium]MDD4722814.1 imidazole glycerol phosphate synthase subunit HisH [Acidaminococcaceae bacterium]
MNGKIVIVDYGMGNLHSVNKALLKVGADVSISSDPIVIGSADKVILPGVGAFGDCMDNLNKYGLTQVLIKVLNSDKPFLGICLGLQLLFEGSEEAPGTKGLGFFKGQVEKIKTNFKIPHMGWNRLELKNNAKLLTNANGEYVYFVHSYHAVPQDKSIITSVCNYGTEITASVGLGNVQAVQFHPEKSSSVGIEILQAFKEWKP